MPLRAQSFLTATSIKQIDTSQKETVTQFARTFRTVQKNDVIGTVERSIFPTIFTSLTLTFKQSKFTSSKFLLVMDSASDCCYITKKALAQIPNHMYLHTGHIRMALETLGGNSEFGCDKIQVRVQFGESKDWFDITLLVVDSIAESPPFSCSHIEKEIGKIRSYHKKVYENSLGRLNHHCYFPNREVDFLLSTKYHDKLLLAKHKNLYPFLPDISLNICNVGEKRGVFSGALKVTDCDCAGTKSFSASLKKLRQKTASFYANDLRGDAGRLEARLLELFRVENLDAHYALSSDLRLEDRIFLETVGESCRFLTGEKRYEIKLPFLTGDVTPKLFNNYQAARDRFLSTERRLTNGLKSGLFKPEAIKKIDDSLLEHINSGRYVELEDQDEAKVSDPEEICNYLPIRLVFNPRSTSTPIRATLDASSPSGNRKMGFGPSLNSCLAAGLCTLPQQTSCHINFRRFKFSFGLDLSRFFLSINIFPDHQRFQRFCFRPFGSKGPIRAFQIRSVCWGLNSSPASCSLVLKKHCKNMVENPTKPHHRSQEFKAAVDSLTDGKSIYADNILQSVETLEGAIQRIEYLEEIFESGGFLSGKYFATDPRILRNLPPEKRCKDNLILFTSADGTTDWMTGSARLLGETFDFESDTYRFGGFEEMYDRYSNCMTISKRDLASCMAKIAFGHIQFRAPYTLLVKTLLMQVAMAEQEEIAALKPDENKPSVSHLWGRDLSPKFLADFRSWIHFLPELEKLRLPRYLPCVDKPFPAKIISFADAGSWSCCSVSYCISWDPFSKRKVSSFIQARVRTKPLSLQRMNEKKAFTIPRLELLALSMAHTNTIDICQDLGLDPRKSAMIFSDSLTALAWAATDQRNLSIWHLNKCRPLQESGVPLRYVISELNSADMGTKIVSPGCLTSDLWRYGPNFLLQPEKDWPKMDPAEKKIDRKSAIYLDGLVKNSVELSFFTKNFSVRNTEIDLQKEHPDPQRTWLSIKNSSYAVLEWLFEKNSMFFPVIRRLGCQLFIFYNLKVCVARSRFTRKFKRIPNTRDVNKDNLLNFLSLQQAYNEARLMFYSWHQRHCFKDEMKALLKQYNQGIPLKQGRVGSDSKLFPLNAKLRFLGRAGYPIILSEGRATTKILLDPGNLDIKKVKLDSVQQRVCKDFLRQLHVTDMSGVHLSKNDLVVKIRAQGVHVLRQNQAARYINGICMGCARHHSKAINQIMGQLPKELSEPAVNRHGQLAVQRYLMVDHCGEFRITTGNPFQRRPTRSNHGIITVHVLLIVDLVSSHLSLYIVPSVSSAWTAFCLKNHSNLYLSPWKVWLDNASGFRNLGSTFQEYFSILENQWKLEREFSTSPTQIEFVFGRPLFSPNQGRVERAVQTVKKCLRSIHGTQLFSYHALQMSLSDIQGIVNTRPICTIDEFRDLEDVHKTILTPKLLLLGQSDSENTGFDIFDAMESVKKSVNLEEQWRFRRHLAQRFSDMYQKELLASREERKIWQVASTNVEQIRPGTVIMFPKSPTESDRQLVTTLGQNANLKGTFYGWPLGRVQDLLRGRDGLVRGVSIKLPDQKVSFEWKNGKYVKKIIKPSTVLTRAINSCRILPAYSKLQEYEDSLLTGPKKGPKKVPTHPMTLRSNNRTFFGTVNEIPMDKRYCLADGDLEKKLHEQYNFFKNMFRYSYNPRPKNTMSRKEKIEKRDKQK